MGTDFSSGRPGLTRSCPGQTCLVCYCLLVKSKTTAIHILSKETVYEYGVCVCFEVFPV